MMPARAAVAGEFAQEGVNNSLVLPSALMESAYRGPCPILGAHVTRVTQKGSTRILCGEYCEAGGICRLKKAALERDELQGVIEASSDGVPLGGTSCVMLTA
jgi:hypothetical protein